MGGDPDLDAAVRPAAHPDPGTMQSSPVIVDGRRRWVSYEDLEEGSGDFERIGADFAGTGQESVGRVGPGSARLCRARDVVDFGVRWIEAHRGTE